MPRSRIRSSESAAGSANEKHAKLSYLVARRVDFLLTRDWANEVLRLDDQLPNVPIDVGPIGGRVITWDPAIMAALAARGVRVPDVPAQIDAYIAGMASRSDADVRRDLERFRRLYFDRTPIRRASCRSAPAWAREARYCRRSRPSAGQRW